MNLKDSSTEELTRTKGELDSFLGDKNNLAKVREILQQEGLSEDEKKVLQIFEKTFLCYIIEDQTSLELKNTINSMEATLANDRNNLELGYIEPEKEVEDLFSPKKARKLVVQSSVQLR